ncbi:MAG: type IV toxin-antitoxin system AbiEi family antitoxin [Luteolibacter sp.]|uniref:type IV toxin-antitoxin system AbiEi family antitoxin domain-containing protein n=1 Tax=Luteolibacter sp. TaxID=1962973 RepID=UPI0032643ABD
MNDDIWVSDLLDDFQRRGLYGFDRSKVETSLSVSSGAVGKALKRLSEKGRVKRLRKGFHAIVPVEYAGQGIPPFDWFIEDLMRSLELPYYIGLLSAAALHGAAHQQVQQLQIIVPRQERPIEVSGLSIRFFSKKDFAATPLQSRKGHSGMLPLSTPEATALDLVRYARHIGGLDVVLTVLSELAESISPDKLTSTGTAESETAYVQRLGWLLDHLGQTVLADALHAALPTSKPLPRATLDPGAPRTGPITGNRWRILENTQPEADL